MGTALQVLTGDIAKTITASTAAGFGTAALSNPTASGNTELLVAIINVVIFIAQTIIPLIKKKKDGKEKS